MLLPSILKQREFVALPISCEFFGLEPMPVQTDCTDAYAAYVGGLVLSSAHTYFEKVLRRGAGSSVDLD